MVMTVAAEPWDMEGRQAVRGSRQGEGTARHHGDLTTATATDAAGNTVEETTERAYLVK
jgi:hypothetical protein